jgi:hypothetical protein
MAKMPERKPDSKTKIGYSPRTNLYLIRPPLSSADLLTERFSGILLRIRYIKK